MTTAPTGRTFFYRNEHKRVIEAHVLNEHRLHTIRGPLVYGVTDPAGVHRYVGKWVSETPLYSGWFRREHLHHQTSSRTVYLRELDAGRGPLCVWSASAAELRPFLGSSVPASNIALAAALEALWIRRWKLQLWNVNMPALRSACDDGEY